MKPKTVGMLDLRKHLSRYLEKVKAGEVIEITEHGKPVGRIIPAGQNLEDRIQVMQKAGLLRWNGRKPRPVKPVAALEGGRSIAQLIVENR